MEWLPVDVLALIVCHVGRGTSSTVAHLLPGVGSVNRRLRALVKTDPRVGASWTVHGLCLSQGGPLLPTHLAAWLSLGVRAHHVSLAYAHLTQEHVDVLASLSWLRTLSLEHVTSDAPLDLTPVAALPWLHTVDVSYCRAELWWAAFPPQLCVLVRRGNNCNDKGLFVATVPELGLHRIESPCFQHVDGWHDAFVGEIDSLLALLPRCPHLQYLNLNGWFPHAVYPNSAEDLRHTPRAPTLARLVAMLHACRALEELRLQRCGALTPAQRSTLTTCCSPRLQIVCDDSFDPGLPARVRTWVDAVLRPMAKTLRFFEPPPYQSRVPRPPAVEGMFRALGNGFAWSLTPNAADNFDGLLALQWRVEEEDRAQPGAQVMSFDFHQPEAYGCLYLSPAQEAWIYWYTSSATTRPLHRGYTLDEYLEEGMRHLFARFWPVPKWCSLLRDSRGLVFEQHSWASMKRGS